MRTTPVRILERHRVSVGYLGRDTLRPFRLRQAFRGRDKDRCPCKSSPPPRLGFGETSPNFAPRAGASGGGTAGTERGRHVVRPKPSSGIQGHSPRAPLFDCQFTITVIVACVAVSSDNVLIRNRPSAATS